MSLSPQMSLHSLLFIPGNQTRKLDKAFDLQPDAFVLDLEDSVPMSEKEVARRTVAEYIDKLADTGIALFPRVNSLTTGLMYDDLKAVVKPGVNGVSVGKITDGDSVKDIAEVLSGLEKDAHLEIGHTKLILWIETARAVINAYEIASASARVIGVAFGAEDFTNDMSIERTSEGKEVAYARSATVVAAHAAGVTALETPYFSFKDLEGLREDCRASAGLGFQGRFAIHPSQIGVIKAAYTPSQEQIKQAQRVVKVFEEAVRKGKAATSLDGVVIDIPVVERARKTLHLAEVAGLESK
tara:strand:+ start:91 stop:984 length:894 start_codon:yes stop_codon:yes gene_type:complete